MSSNFIGLHRTLEKRAFLRRRNRVFIRFAAIGLIAAGCENAETPIAPELVTRPSIYQYVTGEAANALLRNGELRLAPAESQDGTPIITADRAIELASAYVRTYGYFFKPMWERQRGRRVDLASLAPAPRAYFAQTPYGAFPEGFHPGFKRWYGPWYLVTLMSGGTPVVQMAVSAYLTDYKIDDTGRLDRPLLGGNDFVHMAFSAEPNGFAPFGPEEAVARVAAATGARIDRTPQLVRREGQLSPLDAVWELSLERPVSLAAPLNGRETDVLFTGPMGRRHFLTAAPDQPAFDLRVGRRVDNSGRRLAVDHFVVPVRSGRVVKFEEAQLTVAGGVP